jgi:N-hydroxyarylamine O-acetyltransferase
MGLDLDLSAYAARVDYGGEFLPTIEVLDALHLAHATHIPFENLDVLAGRPVRLDIESLWRKLVSGGRGGYCFEHNSLFAAVLEAAGFRVRRLAARVRMGAAGIRARSHMLLAVEAGGGQWLADVGFGADGLLLPVPFRMDIASPQFAWKYRLVQEGASFVLQSWRQEGWTDLYAFGLEEQHPIDFEVANYYTSTYPESFFRKALLAQLPGPDLRLMLFNRKLIERTAEGATETPVIGDEALRQVLATRFGLTVPPGTRLPVDP